MSSIGARRRPGRRGLRLLIGLAISAVFVGATLARVDVGEVGMALGRVDARWLLVALGAIAVEFSIRAARWTFILRPHADVPIRMSAAYLAIGYFANSLLPARLGDLARAYLAGGGFGLPRLSVLGTIVVERLADGLMILGIVVILGLTVLGGGSLLISAVATAVAGVILAGLVWLAVALLWRSGAGVLRDRLRAWVSRLGRGADAVRTPLGLAITAGLTIAAFAAASAMFAFVGSAADIGLSPAEATLAMGAVALSTAIPAAPGSIGTFEFVGVTVLTAFAVPPEAALVAVVIVHLLATLPVAALGLVATWGLHIRVDEIGADADAVIGETGGVTAPTGGSDHGVVP